MHQTTVRFSPDLWEALEAEGAALGVSVAQYLREAALARLAYSAARRGERDYEVALTAVGAELDHPDLALPEAAATDIGPRVASGARLGQIGDEVTETALEVSAVTAQSEQVRHHARAIRDQSVRLRREAAERRAR